MPLAPALFPPRLSMADYMEAIEYLLKTVAPANVLRQKQLEEQVTVAFVLAEGPVGDASPMKPLSDTPSPCPSPWTLREDGLGWVERPAKVVGRLRPLGPKAALQWNNSMLRLSPLCGRWFPKGVFMFKTWAEEQQWTQTQIETALKRLK